MSVESHAISELFLQLLPEMVAHGADPIHRRKVARKLAGFAEADCKQSALRARAPAALVPSAVHQWFERYATAHEQGADSLGRIDFVAGDRQKIDAELVDASWNLADGLGSVSVKQDAVLAGNLADFRSKGERGLAAVLAPGTRAISTCW